MASIQPDRQAGRLTPQFLVIIPSPVSINFLLKPHVPFFLCFLSSIASLPAIEPDQATYKEFAEPFLQQNCFQCHSGETTKGDLDLQKLSPDMSSPEAGDTWNEVFAQIQFGEMPPEKAKRQPSPAEKQVFLNWLDGQLIRYGRGFGLDEKLLLPEFGNYIDHKTLFDGSIQAAPYTPARLWRQRPAIYDGVWSNHYGRTPWLSVKIGSAGRINPRNVVKRGPHKGKVITTRYFNNSRYANPFYEFVHHASGFTDYATIRADQASLEALLTNSEKMAEILTEGLKVKVVTEVKNKDSRHGNNHGGFVGGVETSSIERRGRIPVVFKKIVDAEGDIPQADFNLALDLAFQLFFRRLPEEAERQHYWEKVFQRNASLGNKMALQSVLIYITLSPEFVYRMELGMGEPDEHGRRMLSSQELVYALHYAFMDSPAFGVDTGYETAEAYTKDSEAVIKDALTRGNPTHRPSGWLVELMREGKLKTREDVETAVRKFLDQSGGNQFPNHNSPAHTVRNPRILRFFREFFGYHKAPTVFKDVEKFTKIEGFKQYHSHTPHRLMYDTDTLILHILKEDKDVLRQLLTTSKVFVSYWNGTNAPDQIKRKGNRQKYIETHDVQSYNLDPFEVAYESRGKLPLEVPKGQRFGILTQPSWLVAHSGNFENDPVRRGKWIREKLLAGTIMDIPINVDAQIPDDEHKTLRERFSVVHEEACWRCHKKMNPLGMPFEAFNHVGRFREKELGKPVDTSGEISHTYIQGLDGEVPGFQDMMERIANSDLARQSFLRHVFRYWMGRNEMPSDSQTLIRMDEAYVKCGGSFKETLVSLLTSDSFLYRK